jgi:hypothetical protein
MHIMPNQTVVPDPTQMRRYLDKGLTQSQIVEQWEKDSGTRASRSAIGMAISRYGMKSSRPRERYMDMIPWKLNPEHMHHPEARLLRLEGRVRRGLGLTDSELTWLRNWRRELDDKNAVIVYRPETDQGFWWVDRTDEDDDIIRRPKVA